MTDRKITGRAASIPAGLAAGALVSATVTILISAIGAHLIISEILPQEQIGYCSIFALLASSMLGAVTASKMVKHRNLIVSLLSGMVYFCILLAVTALFFGGQYEGMGVTFIVILLGTAAAALITGREGNTRPKRKRKKISR